MTISTEAQVRTSRTLVKQKSNIEWILRAGLSFNQMSGTDNAGSKTAFAFDFGFNKPIRNPKFYWGMDLGVSSRGCSEFFTYTLKFTPITFGYKHLLTDKIKLDGHIGAFVSADFSDNMIDSSNYYRNSSMWDLGLQFGVGVWYDRFSLDLMYQLGTLEVDSDYGGTAGSFIIRLGVRF